MKTAAMKTDSEFKSITWKGGAFVKEVLCDNNSFAKDWAMRMFPLGDFDMAIKYCDRFYHYGKFLTLQIMLPNLLFENVEIKKQTS